jgi:hypothetical protein
VGQAVGSPKQGFRATRTFRSAASHSAAAAADAIAGRWGWGFREDRGGGEGGLPNCLAKKEGFNLVFCSVHLSYLPKRALSSQPITNHSTDTFGFEFSIPVGLNFNGCEVAE